MLSEIKRIFKSMFGREEHFINQANEAKQVLQEPALNASGSDTSISYADTFKHSMEMYEIASIGNAKNLITWLDKINGQKKYDTPAILTVLKDLFSDMPCAWEAYSIMLATSDFYNKTLKLAGTRAKFMSYDSYTPADALIQNIKSEPSDFILITGSDSYRFLCNDEAIAKMKSAFSDEYELFFDSKHAAPITRKLAASAIRTAIVRKPTCRRIIVAPFAAPPWFPLDDSGALSDLFSSVPDDSIARVYHLGLSKTDEFASTFYLSDPSSDRNQYTYSIDCNFPDLTDELRGKIYQACSDTATAKQQSSAMLASISFQDVVYKRNTVGSTYFNGNVEHRINNELAGAYVARGDYQKALQCLKNTSHSPDELAAEAICYSMVNNRHHKKSFSLLKKVDPELYDYAQKILDLFT